MALVAWRDTYELLSQLQSPTGEELEELATSAYMLGDEDEWRALLERAAGRWTESGRGLRAARCAFWIGTSLALRGEMGPAGGWLGRAQRLVDAEGRECVEQGYLMLPVAFQHDATGDADRTVACARGSRGSTRRWCR